ncbi:MAG TPA: hypothetical protein VJN70_10225 [Gemmatimonadaceae bacterium]|nr:hypothetical protein [Gemmatimonadaceae bacterium]
MTSPQTGNLSSTSIPTAKEFLFSLAALDDEALAKQEKAFFRSIRLRNGTYKTTYSRRLDNLNEIANRLLPAERPLEIMDVAASSGVATLEWIESLENSGIDFSMTAGDLCVRAFLLSLGRFLNVLVDSSGYPLQFDFVGKAIAFPPPKRLALKAPPLFLGVHAGRWIVPTLFAMLFKRATASREGAARQRFGIVCRETLLISPRLSRRTSLTILDDDLLARGSFENRFHVIRAANVLNRTYFNDETLSEMITNLRSRLRRSGLLIVCRTHDDGVNHGTVFRLTNTRDFEIVRRIGNGSEIESLVV